MSQEELDTRQTVAPITTNTDEQFQILCEIALKKAAMRDQQTMDPMYPLQSRESPVYMRKADPNMAPAGYQM